MICSNYEDQLFERVLQTKKIIYQHILEIYESELRDIYIFNEYFSTNMDKNNLEKIIKIRSIISEIIFKMNDAINN
jgi:hypothetical protein